MKKIFLYIFIYIVAAGFFTACSDSWDDRYSEVSFEGVIAPSLNIDKETLEFSEQASNQELGISANGRWMAASSDRWLTLSSEQGWGSASLTVSVEANTNAIQERRATITISNGIVSYKVSVKQSAMDEYLQVTPSTLSYSFEGGSSSVSVDANVSWTVSSDASWLKVSKNSDNASFSVTVQQLMNTQSRQAVITVKGVAQSKTIEVSQSGVQAPVVAKVSMTNITKHEATCNFQATSRDIDITEYGVCYSSSFQTPSQENADAQKQAEGGKSVSQTFVLKNLSSKTTYYVRPYVVTALGTLYGETTQFTTSASAPNENDNGTPTD